MSITLSIKLTCFIQCFGFLLAASKVFFSSCFRDVLRWSHIQIYYISYQLYINFLSFWVQYIIYTNQFLWPSMFFLKTQNIAPCILSRLWRILWLTPSNTFLILFLESGDIDDSGLSLDWLLNWSLR